MHGKRELVDVHVARRDLAPRARNPDDGLLKIRILKTRRAQHRAIGRAAVALGHYLASGLERRTFGHSFLSIVLTGQTCKTAV